MSAAWIVTASFLLLLWFAHSEDKSKVAPVNCVDVWPRSLCNATLKQYGKSICTKNNFFGRYECCITCAQALHIAVTDGKFEAKNNFTFYHPMCPDPTDATMANGESWQPWCRQWIDEEEGPAMCQIADIQYRCYKTCNVACKA
uniref:ShKT domain-containing protein n=1 Tax=Trichuris muris TaxID=70415 RepID=A0A5S6PYK3_TRIMR